MTKVGTKKGLQKANREEHKRLDKEKLQGSVRRLTEAEIASMRSRVGKWIASPDSAKKWILLQHGMILFRLGDMLLREEYKTFGDFKDDLREFQEWASVFGGMLTGYRQQRDAEEDEQDRATEKTPKSLPWERARQDI